jgi:hypothetical protein
MATSTLHQASRIFLCMEVSREWYLVETSREIEKFLERVLEISREKEKTLESSREKLLERLREISRKL